MCTIVHAQHQGEIVLGVVQSFLTLMFDTVISFGTSYSQEQSSILTTGWCKNGARIRI